MTVTLQRSRGLLLYLVLVYTLAGALVLLLRLNGLLTLLISVLLVVSMLRSCQRYGWLNGQALISHVYCDGQERWFLEGKHRQKASWRLQHGVILGPLMILSFSSRATRRMQPVLVARDAVDAEIWRQLCLKLRDPETWD